MSRTYRKMHCGRIARSMKDFHIFFPREQARLPRWKVARGFVETRSVPKHKFWYPGRGDEEALDLWLKAIDFEQMHHYVFRNGSCRRQRIHGVALSKRLYRHEVRRKLQRELQRTVIELYADEPDHTGTRPHKKSEGWL